MLFVCMGYTLWVGMNFVVYYQCLFYELFCVCPIVLSKVKDQYLCILVEEWLKCEFAIFFLCLILLWVMKNFVPFSAKEVVWFVALIKHKVGYIIRLNKTNNFKNRFEIFHNTSIRDFRVLYIYFKS